MNVTCPRCGERPRPTINSRYCRPCEREYRAETKDKVRAKNKKYREKNKERIAKQREDKIGWWMNLGREEFENIERWYREQSKQLPREYHVAMNRLERSRRLRELEHLNSLPKGLASAALRWRRANLSGSRAKDAREHYDKSPYFGP